MVSIIAAVTADKGAIGRKGDLIFHLSDDLKHFKALTTGHTVIMGRRTFESLPKGALPNRRNIVVTRNDSFSAPSTERAASLEEAVAMALATDTDPFIIGGGEIYRQAMPLADALHLTMVEEPTPADADTFFPEIEPDTWEVTGESRSEADSKSGLRYRFVDFTRRRDR